MCADYLESQCGKHNLNCNDVLDNLNALVDIFGFIDRPEDLSDNLIFVVCTGYYGYNHRIRIYLCCDGSYCIYNVFEAIMLCTSKNFIDIINYLDTKLSSLRKNIISKLVQIESLE
jgi:hypothetical protein